MRHHVLISGTGRTGTTFLVQLLTQLGLDTGFRKANQRIYPGANAGMELSLRRPDVPYIVKSFRIREFNQVLDEGDVVIDHAIIPVRDLFAAAESRREVSRRAEPGQAKVAGGLWGTTDPEEQEDVLVLRLYELIHILAKHEVPTTFLNFPRLVQEPDYLYRTLDFLLGSIDYETFGEAFAMLARPDLVHDFQRPRRSKGRAAVPPS